MKSEAVALGEGALCLNVPFTSIAKLKFTFGTSVCKLIINALLSC